MKRYLAVFLVLVLLSSVSALGEGAIAVRVGKSEYTAQEVQKYVNESVIAMQMLLGGDDSGLYDEEVRAEFLNEAAEHFVTIGVLNAKLEENGLFEISEDEETALRDFARENYEALWQRMSEQISQAYPDLEDSERYITMTMEAAGYSLDGIYEKALLEMRQLRLIDLYCSDIEVSDEDVLAYYEENAVAADREKYEDNPDKFDMEVFLGGGSSSYVPEGYFYIKYILLTPSDDAQRRIDDCARALETATDEKAAAYDAIAAAAVANGELDELRKAYAEAEEREITAAEALEEATRSVEEDYLPIAELARAALTDGTTFDELIHRYSTDTITADGDGYPFHRDSMIWDTRMSERVAALEKSGDVTDPVYAGGHVYIVCRMEDMRSGAYELDEEAITLLRENLLYDRQLARLNELTEEWRADMDVSIDVSALVFPEI